MALVHGTDLLFAAARRTQHRRPASDRAGLPRHRGSHHRDHRPPPLPGTHAGHTCIEHIPWGVPDALLATPPPAQPRTCEPLRLLYAGRLTPKGLHTSAETLTSIPGPHLSIAGPPAEYTARLGGLERTRGRTTYLG
ncbi:hypothetical protein ACFQE7_27380 [Nonomuraea ferruginea]|uniref:hypothetical protein n=1 Tax=Nonomuraea ferruginea TaxID=46174 RepID=UPI00361D0998